MLMSIIKDRMFTLYKRAIPEKKVKSLFFLLYTISPYNFLHAYYSFEKVHAFWGIPHFGVNHQR